MNILTTVTFTVNNAVSVPAGTFIRLELVDVKSPLSPSSAYQVTVTTRDPANGVIDGPTPSTAYNIRRIGSNDIANNAVTTTQIANGAVTSGDLADNSITSTKPAESFMKRVTLVDNDNGHADGWDPNGAVITFTIEESEVTQTNDVFFNIEITGFIGAPIANFFCDVTGHNTAVSTFTITCSTAPPENSELHYVVGNLPDNFNPG